MPKKTASMTQLLRENDELRARLEEAEETLRAIRSGEVDALVVSTAAGEQVFTLTGAEHAYRLLIEAMNEGALTLAHDGVILYCNACFAKMVKTPLEKVIGGSIRRFVAPGDLPMFEAILQQGLQGSSKGELTFQTGDGTLLPIYLSVNPLQNGGGAGSICMVATDLTGQKRSEEIVAAEKLARSILEQTAEDIVVCDESGRVIRASRAAHRLCGSNPVFQPFDDAFPLRIVPAESSPENKGKPFSLAMVLQGGTRQGLEVIFERRDGQVFNLLLSLGTLVSGQQTLGCVVGLTDITARKRAEEQTRQLLAQAERSRRSLLSILEDQKLVAEALRKKNDQLDLVLKAAHMGVSQYNFQTDVIRRIQGSGPLSGLLGEVYPKSMETLLALVHPEDREMVKESIWQAPGQKEDFEIEFRALLPDGTIRWVVVRGRFSHDESGKILFLTGVDLDITERKRAEEALMKAYAELKQTQAQLIQAAKAEVIGRLAGGVAHEVKNPLAIIMQGIDYLSANVPVEKEDVSLALKYMNDAVKRADNIIRGLMDFSRASEIKRVPENLNSIIESTLLFVKNLFDRHRIELIKELGEGILPLDLDKNRMEQVFLNLFLNAMDAMPGGGQIKVRTYKEEQTEDGGPGETVVVAEVEDTGAGIPEDILDKIFDPFFTTKRDKGGTGLGLSIVRNLVEIQGGEIKIENRRDRSGVRATVRFK